MNIKDFLMPLAIAFIATFFLQYFFLGKNDTSGQSGIKSGQKFIAPESKEKPINFGIDFIDEKRSQKEVISEIETSYATFVFSSDGAALERLMFKQKLNGTQKLLTTIYPSLTNPQEQRSFLVALNDQTPYYYEFLGKEETDYTIELAYKVHAEERGTIEKRFIIHKNIHQLDMVLSITPAGKKPIQARIFYQAPSMPEIASQDIVSAIVNTQKGTIQKIARPKIDTHTGWFAPTIFGAENKYFVHAMVKDDNQFAQRAYYKLYGHEGIDSILEGPEVNQHQQWTLSFYLGPKTDQAMAPVDPRLEQALDYSGMLAPLARFLLAILKFIYSYIPNYGWAIIILTALIKLILLPFSVRGEGTMKKRSGEIERKLNYLKERYKNDPETLTRERAELMRQQALPGMMGCLPLLIQIPIFFALSRILSSSIELYQAPFILWIHDLSARDPYYILPIIITVTMFVQALYVDPKQRMSTMAAGLVFGAVTANLAAGLALYLVVSTLLGLMQNAAQKKLKVV